MPASSLYYLIAGLLIVVGLAGIVLPALPGLPLVFAGMLLAAWAGGFAKIGVSTLIVLAVLTLLSMGVDLWAAAFGAKRVGASRMALVGAILGTFAGFFLGPVGLFVGPFVGALVGELLHARTLDAAGLGHAAKVGIGTWVGMALGIALKLMLAFAMLGLFAWAWVY